MLLPLDVVLRRGVVFRWIDYDELDDPAFAGKSKPKFIVILSNSALDDPLIYILTTSERAKHEHHPFPGDLVHIARGSYGFLPVDTLIDAGTAGEREVGRDEFIALYNQGSVVYQGALDDSHCVDLLQRITASRRVSTKLKRIIGS